MFQKTVREELVELWRTPPQKDRCYSPLAGEGVDSASTLSWLGRWGLDRAGERKSLLAVKSPLICRGKNGFSCQKTNLSGNIESRAVALSGNWKDSLFTPSLPTVQTPCLQVVLSKTNWNLVLLIMGFAKSQLPVSMLAQLDGQKCGIKPYSLWSWNYYIISSVPSGKGARSWQAFPADKIKLHFISHYKTMHKKGRVM